MRSISIVSFDFGTLGSVLLSMSRPRTASIGKKLSKGAVSESLEGQALHR